MEYLYDKLTNYSNSDYYGFHMPGHKRNREVLEGEFPFNIDITEIEGFDDLHHARGILQEAQKRAAEVFCAEESHFLVNGSTVGILSAVLGCTERGNRILIARNCHKSVYNGVYLNGLTPVYVYPEYIAGMGFNGEIRAYEVEQALDLNPDIKAVIITSPTYDGVVSDIRRIADLVHRRNIPLILDEAHGAHFGFHPYFPENGNMLGADIVIQSLHKTLPALTQTAVLHINGGIVDRERVRKYLHMLQSSSPSYVLMASIDECVRLLSEKKEALFQSYVKRLDKMRKELSNLENLHLAETEHYDRAKVVITVPDRLRKANEETNKFTGKELYNILNQKYLLQMEMAAESYAIAMTSLADTDEGMDRLVKALFEIDGKLAKYGSGERKPAKCEGAELFSGIEGNQVVCSPFEAEKRKAERGSEAVPFEECEGRIALEFAYVYPPGIPAAVPGERILAGTVEMLDRYRKAGLRIEGVKNEGKIEVLI